MVFLGWTGLGGRLVEGKGRGRLGTVDERKETRWQDCRGGLALRAGGDSWDQS